MQVKEGLLYSEDHEWVKIESGIAEVGLTDYAQSKLGDVVFVNLPEVGDKVSCGKALGDVESVKAVSDILSPVCGEVSEVNPVPADDPAAVNRDPYGTWLIRVAGAVLAEGLMDAAAYGAFCEGEK